MKEIEPEIGSIGYIKIYEKFFKTITCVEDVDNRPCSKCIFGAEVCYGIKCSADDRKDGKNVHFEEVKDE